jgi:hypothetical protein
LSLKTNFYLPNFIDIFPKCQIFVIDENGIDEAGTIQ